MDWETENAATFGTLACATVHAPENERRANKGFLFGTKPISIENKGSLEEQTQTKPNYQAMMLLQLVDYMNDRSLFSIESSERAQNTCLDSRRPRTECANLRLAAPPNPVATGVEAYLNSSRDLSRLLLETYHAEAVAGVPRIERRNKRSAPQARWGRVRIRMTVSLGCVTAKPLDSTFGLHADTAGHENRLIFRFIAADTLAMMLAKLLRSTLMFCVLTLLLASGIPLFCQRAAAVGVDIHARFQDAQSSLQAGRFEQAIAGFREVLKLQPDLVEAQVDLGLAYYAAGDYQSAVTELHRAEAKRPGLLPVTLFLGLSYMKLGSAEKAIPALRQALVIDASNQPAQHALATAELSEGDYQEAASEFRKLAETQRNKADAWFSLGQSYLQMAKALTADLSLRYRNSAWSLRLAGDVLCGRSLWNNAAQAYLRALRADSGQPGLHAALGEAFLRDGKTEEAESEFQAELSQDAHSLQGLMGVAQTQLLKQNPEASLTAITKLWNASPDFLLKEAPNFLPAEIDPNSARRLARDVDRAPDSPSRQFLLSALYGRAGDRGRSNQELSGLEESAKAADVRTKKPTSLLTRSACQNHQELACTQFLAAQRRLSLADLLLLGRTLFAMGRDLPASGAFSAALADDRNGAEARYWLSRSYLQLAEACFGRLTAAYPSSWRTHELEGETFHVEQRDNDAITQYELAERLKPGDSKIHEALGELFLEQSALQKARAELQTALRLNPGAPRSLYLLGSLYVSEREPAQGIPYLEAALRHDPGLLEARPVLGKAYLRIGKSALAVAQLEQSMMLDRYGDLHYLLYEAYREEGKPRLAAQALARSQQLRKQSAIEDQAKIRPAD